MKLKLFIITLLICNIASLYAFEIYNSDAPIAEDSSKPLTLFIQAEQIQDKPEKLDPDVYKFLKNALIEFSMTNSANFHYPHLQLDLLIYARNRKTKKRYLACAGSHQFQIKKLESYKYRTDQLFFGKDKRHFRYLPKYQSGDKYYGYIIAIWNANELVGFHTHPRFLKKHKQELAQIKKNLSKRTKSSRRWLSKEERKPQILKNRALRL